MMLLTVIAPVARRDSLVGWQQLFLQTLTVSVKASVLTFPAVASEDEALPPEVRIKYRDDPNNNIYVLPRTIIMPE